jgi:hypothetical protein
MSEPYPQALRNSRTGRFTAPCMDEGGYEPRRSGPVECLRAGLSTWCSGFGILSLHEKAARTHPTTAGRVSDRDCSIFEKAISMGRGRCLYLGRWISPKSSGKRFAAASLSRSGRARPSAADARGEILAMCSTGSCGFCARARRGRTFRAATRRTRRVMTDFRSGSARECLTESWPCWPRTFGSAASWI